MEGVLSNWKQKATIWSIIYAGSLPVAMYPNIAPPPIFQMGRWGRRMAARPTSGKFRRGGLAPRLWALSRSLLRPGWRFSVLVHQWGPIGVVGPMPNSRPTAIPRNRIPPAGGPRPPSGKLRRGGMLPRIGVPHEPYCVAVDVFPRWFINGGPSRWLV